MAVEEELNQTYTNLSMQERLYSGFVFSPYAQAVSGVFVWSALFLTCFQIFQHLRFYTVPEQQLWIVRILFIIPIYGFCSWLGLLVPQYSIYFDAIRSCYEAFVIYNFLRLCLAYLGGEATILADINGKPISRRCWDGTCCFPKVTYSVRFLRFCKQATLQFCIVKPIVTVIIIILEACGVYNEGTLRLTSGYIYCTTVYNVSVTLALYGLVLFYSATRHMLSSHQPVLKFLSIKFIVFISFWQGVLLTILHLVPGHLLKDSVEGRAYQNFLITIEMFMAAILLKFAFPYKPYMELRKDANGRGIPMQQITSNFKDTLNPHDVVDDAIHNFSRVYQKYAQQEDMSDDEDSGGGRRGGGRGGGEKRSHAHAHHHQGENLKGSAKKSQSSEFERAILLVESDEDEIL